MRFTSFGKEDNTIMIKLVSFSLIVLFIITACYFNKNGETDVESDGNKIKNEEII